MLQKEALLIKEQLENPELKGFHASNGWLEPFKKIHGIREDRICGEGDDVPIVTVKAWSERLPDIIKDYEPCDHGIWMSLVYFSKPCVTKDWSRRKNPQRVGKRVRRG